MFNEIDKNINKINKLLNLDNENFIENIFKLNNYIKVIDELLLNFNKKNLKEEHLNILNRKKNKINDIKDSIESKVISLAEDPLNNKYKNIIKNFSNNLELKKVDNNFDDIKKISKNNIELSSNLNKNIEEDYDKLKNIKRVDNKILNTLENLKKTYSIIKQKKLLNIFTLNVAMILLFIFDLSLIIVKIINF